MVFCGTFRHQYAFTNDLLWPDPHSIPVHIIRRLRLRALLESAEENLTAGGIQHHLQSQSTDGILLGPLLKPT